MGGRGSNSSASGGKLESIKGSNDEETRFIHQLAEDIDYLDNSDLQGEAEAYIMKKVGAENYRRIMTESDQLVIKARMQWDINYVNNLRIGEGKEYNSDGKIVAYHYSAYDYSNNAQYPKKVNEFRVEKKLTKKQVRQRILDDMNTIPF